MGKKVLPLKEPIVKGFSHQATLLSILMSYEQCNGWICNNYIQTFTLLDLKSNEDRLGTLDFFYMEYCDFNRVEYKANPWIRYCEMPLLFMNYSDLLIEDIVLAINAEMYVTVDIDPYYIPAYCANYHYEHVLLVNGFDSDKQIFYCMDNIDNGKLMMFEVSFSDMQISVEARMRTFKEEYEFCRDNPGPLLTTLSVAPKIYSRKYPSLEKIDIKRIAYLLEAYIKPETFYMTYSDNEYYAYGIACYHELKEYFNDCFLKEKEIDIRAIYSLMDHKTLMVWRLMYIRSEMNIELDEYIHGFEEIRSELQRVIMRLMKFNIGKKKIPWNVLDILLMCREKEYKIVKKLICELLEKDSLN